MNKTEFLKAVAEQSSLSVKDATNFYDSFVKVVETTLKKEEKIQLVGFGTFELKSKAAREGINPLTKQPISIAASKAPAFKAGKAFKDSFN